MTNEMKMTEKFADSDDSHILLKWKGEVQHDPLYN